MPAVRVDGGMCRGMTPGFRHRHRVTPHGVGYVATGAPRPTASFRFRWGPRPLACSLLLRSSPSPLRSSPLGFTLASSRSHVCPCPRSPLAVLSCPTSSLLLVLRLRRSTGCCSLGRTWFMQRHVYEHLTSSSRNQCWKPTTPCAPADRFGCRSSGGSGSAFCPRCCLRCARMGFFSLVGRFSLVRSFGHHLDSVDIRTLSVHLTSQ